MWRRDQGSSKISEDDIANCLGCLFGELLRAEFGSEWKFVTDDYGTDLALHIITSSDHTWETFPLQFVAKRVGSDEDESGFFSAFVLMMHQEMQKAKWQ